MSDAPKSTSPDGRYVIEVDMWEARLSHWIETPVLIDTRGRITLLRFEDSSWSLDLAEWTSDTVVRMHLRKYPGDHTPAVFALVVDCAAGSAVLGDTMVAELRYAELLLERAYAAGRRS